HGEAMHLAQQLLHFLPVLGALWMVQEDDIRLFGLGAVTDTNDVRMLLLLVQPVSLQVKRNDPVTLQVLVHALDALLLPDQYNLHVRECHAFPRTTWANLPTACLNRVICCGDRNAAAGCNDGTMVNPCHS